jgi:hypothetical protein
MPVWQFGNDRGAAARALLLAEALFEGPRGGSRNVPFAWEYKVCGVGLFARNETNVVPALFVETAGPVSELSALNWNNVAEAGAALRAVFGTNLEWLGEVVAVRVPPTLLHANPGDGVRVLKNTGLLGSAVTWKGGRGYLTAGHVAQGSGNAVHDSRGSKLGDVVFIRTGSSAVSGGCTSSSVDVAVIESAPGVTVLSAGISGTGMASPRAAVNVYTASGPVGALIYAATQWWWMSGMGVALTQVYLSGSSVTGSGDSGGPVTLSASPNVVIGHVVGGNAVLSCFQDVDHQLAEIRGDPAFSTIAI